MGHNISICFGTRHVCNFVHGHLHRNFSRQPRAYIRFVWRLANSSAFFREKETAAKDSVVEGKRSDGVSSFHWVRSYFAIF
eukprot:08130_2